MRLSIHPKGNTKQGGYYFYAGLNLCFALQTFHRMHNLLRNEDQIMTEYIITYANSNLKLKSKSKCPSQAQRVSMLIFWF